MISPGPARRTTPFEQDQTKIISESKKKKTAGVDKLGGAGRVRAHKRTSCTRACAYVKRSLGLAWRRKKMRLSQPKSQQATDGGRRPYRKAARA